MAPAAKRRGGGVGGEGINSVFSSPLSRRGRGAGGVRVSHVTIRRWEIVALLAIILMAGGLRFYRLDRFPPGLHYDEAFNGVTARDMLATGRLAIYFPANMGQEPLHMYLVAAALWLADLLGAGQTPAAIRAASALCGLLTVVLAWWLGRELYPLLLPPASARSSDTFGSESLLPRRATAHPLNPLSESVDSEPVGDGPAWLGLGTAFVLAILYWHLSLSRMGMEPITVPLLAVLTFALLCHGLNTGRRLAFALAGLALGGSIYTYKAGYFVPVLAAAFIAYLALAARGLLRRHARGLVLLAVLAVLTALPLVAYFVAHPADFAHRPGDVLTAQSAAEETARPGWLANISKVLGMFFIRGDTDPRNNLPGRPALDPFLAVLFLVGLVRALVDALRGRPAAGLVLLWLVIMTLPTLITLEAPHFRRAVGVTPILAVLCALGASTLLRLPRFILPPAPAGGIEGGPDCGPASATHPLNLAEGPSSPVKTLVRALCGCLLAAGLLFSAVSTIRAYFWTWGRGPDAFFAYDVGLVDIAAQVNALPPGEEAYLTPTASDHYTLRFLLRRPLAGFDGRHGAVYPPPGRSATVFIQLLEDRRTLPALQRARPDGALTWTTSDPWARPYAAAYHLPAAAQPAPAPDRAAGVSFGPSITLLGYSLDAAALAPGQPLTLTLVWTAAAPLDRDYTVFTHVLGPFNPAASGPLWAGHDSQPDGGRYPTGAWQPGEIILDLHRLVLPPDALPGDYQLEVGLYLLDTLERLPAAASGGARLPDDAFVFGSFTLPAP